MHKGNHGLERWTHRLYYPHYEVVLRVQVLVGVVLSDSLKNKKYVPCGYVVLLDHRAVPTVTQVTTLWFQFLQTRTYITSCNRLYNSCYCSATAAAAMPFRQPFQLLHLHSPQANEPAQTRNAVYRGISDARQLTPIDTTATVVVLLLYNAHRPAGVEVAFGM